MPHETVINGDSDDQSEFDDQCRAWLEAMASGDEGALTSLYDATLGRVYGVAFSTLR